jgi:5-methylcytosine-specific restriction protein B
VLTGAPGSGKTERAQRICKAAEFVPWVVTATDSWTTFETIGGYFPKMVDGQDRLDFEPGLLVSAIAQGKILIIDEINRADIDKAFGELFTLLSGTSVNLPFRRNDGGENDGKRIRLQVPGDHDPGDAEVIAVPDWWRMVGAMNDADKASLKRLSFAFMRRFAFVPVPLPAPGAYEGLIQQAAVASGLAATHAEYVEGLKGIFARVDGLQGLALGMGFAIPKAMIKQALAELGLDPARTSHTLLGSGLELYLAPQLQGRADKHLEVLAFLEPRLDAQSLARFEAALMNWTGFVP